VKKIQKMRDKFYINISLCVHIIKQYDKHIMISSKFNEANYIEISFIILFMGFSYYKHIVK